MNENASHCRLPLNNHKLRPTSASCDRVPMYYETKVLFVLYLWHPKTQGAVYLYNTFLQPFLSQNEASIDQCVVELRTSFLGYAATYFQKCAISLDALSHSCAPTSAMLHLIQHLRMLLMGALAAGLSTSCRPMPIMQLHACNSFRPR